ncbi:MAG: transporter [Vulcanimicrobiaceae bacterium]
MPLVPWGALAGASVLLLTPCSALAADAGGAAVAQATAPASRATAPPATTPEPSGSAAATAAPSVDDVRALGSRLDALQQQNAAQQSEIERLRSQIGRLRGSDAPPAADVPPSSTTLKSAPNSRSVETVYQQQNAAFNSRLTLTPSLTTAYSDNRFFTLNGFLALNAIFLGNVNVTQQRSDVKIAALDATYGLSPRLQLEANVPYYLRTSNFSSVGANFAGQLPSEDRVHSGGVGDVQLGAFYQLRRETLATPGVTLNAHVSVPTGRAPYGIALVADKANTNLVFPSILPTGSGVLGYEVGFNLVKTSDPAIFFGGINYYAQTSAHFDDLQFSFSGVKTPGFAMPGNAIQFQIGTAFALNEKTSLSFGFIDTATNAARVHPDGGIPTTIVGSATNAAVLDISAGFASNAHRTLITDLQFGLTQDAPNFNLGFRVPTRF